jgi:hypothetical protein
MRGATHKLKGIEPGAAPRLSGVYSAAEICLRWFTKTSNPHTSPRRISKIRVTKLLEADLNSLELNRHKYPCQKRHPLRLCRLRRSAVLILVQLAHDDRRTLRTQPLARCLVLCLSLIDHMFPRPS